MKKFEQFQGVFAAALTPLNERKAIALDDLPPFLDFLAGRGCHGALLFGTTGEGPSFSVDERIALMKMASEWKTTHPSFLLFAGVGTPSLEETILLTRAAFETGMDAALVLPPYYYRNVSDDGLYEWFKTVITKAVPKRAALFGYHIPRVTGVPLSLELLARLLDAFPEQFAGIKDSSADPEHAKALGKRFGKDLMVFNGTDPLFLTALGHQAVGCITALANIVSPFLREIWNAYQDGELAIHAQQQLGAIRSITDAYAPAPPLLKFLAAKGFNQPYWSVCPPLLHLAAEKQNSVWEELNALPFNWRS